MRRTTKQEAKPDAKATPDAKAKAGARAKAKPDAKAKAKADAKAKAKPDAKAKADAKANARSGSASEPKTPKPAPQQERSKRRHAAIVDAAAWLFAEEPFPVVTMDAIAQRAGTPIGSVYQFFADKRAVFAAVMARSNERAREAFDGVAAAAARGPLLPFGAVIAAAIDGFAALQASDPAIRAANKNLTFLGELVAEDEALQRELSARTAELLALYFPGASADLRGLVATTVVDIVTSFLVLADRRDRGMGRRQLEECKLIVRLYVEARLGD